MGSEYQETTFDGALTPKQVAAAFRQRQAEDEAEYGHRQGYSGHFNVVGGIDVVPDGRRPDLATMERAREWIIANRSNSEPAVAIRVPDPTPEEPERRVWYVGAWCRS